MSKLRSSIIRLSLFASAIGCAIASAAPYPPASTHRPSEGVHAGTASRATEPPPDTQNFPTLPGVQQFFWDQIYYNTSTCADLGPGTFSPVVAPQQGTLTYTVQKRKIHDGTCAGSSFQAADVFYTWTGSGANSDSFELQFTPPDGSTPTDFFFTAQLATTTVSYYAVAGNRNGQTLGQWMLQQGASDGAVAAQSGAPAGIIVLDFGDPRIDKKVYGATGLTKGGFITTSDIAAAVLKFASGYAKTSGGRPVTLLVTTNNEFLDKYTDAMIQAHAQAWGQMVSSLGSQVGGGISVAGGFDAEVLYSTPAQAREWFDSFSGGLLYDVGDANSCPTSGSSGSPVACANGWTQEDIRYISWSGAGLPLPEIYATKGGNAKQWQQIALYTDLAFGSQMLIQGPLTEAGACSTRKCNGIDNTPAQGWYQLWNDLDVDTRTTLYPTFFGASTDITWRP
jgi:hypothetical protein